MHRFYAPTLDPGDELVALPRDEAEHLTRVLRLGAGDTVAVFDGRGSEFLAKVSSALRRDVKVQLVSRLEPAAEGAVPLTLVQAVLKGDKMDDVVRDAVMLGVAAVQPIVTKRSETTVAALIRSAKTDRWHRVAIASVKQSRRAVVPEIHVPLTIETMLDEPAAALRLMLVEPSADADVEPISIVQAMRAPADAALFIGPEGGWTPQECAAAHQRGVRLVSLGQRTLRADAVAVAAISILQFVWKDL